MNEQMKMMNLGLWISRMAIVATVAGAFNGSAFAQAVMMNEDLMARLIKFTRDQPDSRAPVDARICKVLDLCDGTKDMPLKLAKSDSTDGIHYFGLPLDTNSKDVLIMVKHDTGVSSYLTDKTGRLRVAAILEKGTAHLITNEKAAAKFNAELPLFAKESAEQLPKN